MRRVSRFSKLGWFIVDNVLTALLIVVAASVVVYVLYRLILAIGVVMEFWS